MDKYHIGVEEAKKMVAEDGDLNEPIEEPEWIEEGKGFLEGVSDETWWRGLIEKWIKFEASLGYPDGSMSMRNLSSSVSVLTVFLDPAQLDFG